MSEVKDIDRLLEQSRKNLKGAYGVGLKGWVANIPFLIEENKSKDIKVELQATKKRIIELSTGSIEEVFVDPNTEEENPDD